MTSQPARRWYARPVLFLADINRAIHFYAAMLGFEKSWHEADGAGKVCQGNHGECEIILCEDANRSDKGRLFIELTAEGFEDLRNELAKRSVPAKEGWWAMTPYKLMIPTAMNCSFLFRARIDSSIAARTYALLFGQWTAAATLR